MKYKKEEERERILKLIDDIDLELMFTDIKDKKGNKFELSDELMEVISLWWDKKSKQLKDLITAK